MVKLSVNETKWSSLPARTRALILYISILMFDFGPEKLPGLSRNGPLAIVDQEYEWFTDYLKGRPQVVGSQGAFSDAESICVGVPQGSILGPLLVLLHVNDLPTAARKCSMLMYADDTVLFYFGKVAATIEKSLNEDLDLIGSWLYNNSLFLNAVKTEAMLFGTHARLSDADFGITFKGQPIKRVF